MSSTASTPNILETGLAAAAEPIKRNGKSGRNIIVGLLIGLLLLLLLGLLIYWMWPSPTTTTPTTNPSTTTPMSAPMSAPMPMSAPTSAPTPYMAAPANMTGPAGTWAAYNAQGVPTNYTYQISQTGNTLNFTDTNMPSMNSTGTINNNAITAP